MIFWAMFGSVLVFVLGRLAEDGVFCLLSGGNPDVWIGFCIPQVNLYRCLSPFLPVDPMFGSGPALAFCNAGTDPNIGGSWHFFGRLPAESVLNIPMFGSGVVFAQVNLYRFLSGVWASTRCLDRVLH